MLSSHESKNLTYLLTTFLDSEAKGWTSLDDFLEFLDYLNDDEIYREADALYSVHKNKKMGCRHLHKDETKCFILPILEGVESILNLYSETGNMHPNNRYILANYLALVQDGQILQLE